MRYQYDIFISYRHDCSTTRWMREVFLPELRDALTPHRPGGIEGSLDAPTDEHILPGSNWPAWLREKLACSRLLLPMLTPYYFGSAWCRRELALMLERQRRLGICSAQNLQGLVIPIQLCDGHKYPEILRSEVQFQDFRDLTDIRKGTRKWYRFKDEIAKLALAIDKILDGVPSFDISWGSLTGDDLEPLLRIPDAPSYQLPRLLNGADRVAGGAA
jgi:hypothetical protein